jgi:hypothetical protein
MEDEANGIKKEFKPYKYKKVYAKRLEDHLAEGYSFESFGGDIDVGKTTLYEWLKYIPEFKQAHDRGLRKGLDFYEKLLRKKASKKTEGDTTALIFTLKTRFHKIYGDKSKLDLTSSDGSMSPKVSDDEVNAIVEAHLKKKNEGS